jgi:teichuronic acid biosynthesis glycosyltransferase TuaG
MNDPLVSVILTSYNSSIYLENSLISLVNQTYSTFEIIIIDDCSTDNSIELLGNFVKNNPERSISLFRNLKNIGQAASLNVGLDNAKGAYLCLIDSDDKISPDFISKMTNKIESGFQFVYCGFDIVDTINKSVIAYEKNRKFISNSQEIISEYMNAHNHFSFVGAIYDLSFLIKYNIRFNESNRYGCDIEFICDLFLKKPYCSCVPENLYFYIVRPDSLSTDNECPNIFHCVEGMDRIQKKIPNIYKRFRFSITRKGNMIFHVIIELSNKGVQKQISFRHKLYYSSHFLLQILVNRKSKFNKDNFSSLIYFLKS